MGGASSRSSLLRRSLRITEKITLTKVRKSIAKGSSFSICYPPPASAGPSAGVGVRVRIWVSVPRASTTGAEGGDGRYAGRPDGEVAERRRRVAEAREEIFLHLREFFQKLGLGGRVRKDQRKEDKRNVVF